MEAALTSPSSYTAARTMHTKELRRAMTWLLATGRPSKEDVDAVRSPFAATMLESLPCGRPLEMHKLFPTARCSLPSHAPASASGMAITGTRCGVLLHAF